MRHFVVALALVCGASSTGVAQRVTVGPDVLAGIAGRDSGDPFGGVQARVQVDLDAFAGSIAYRWIGIGRTCKTSLPPICGIDTPGGQLFLVGVSRRVAGGTGTHLRGGMEIGVGRFLNNASTARDTRPLIGATLELRVPVGVGTVMIGGLVEWTRHIWFGAATLGFGVRI